MNKDLTNILTGLEEINRIKQAIKKAILDLPANPNINRISDNPKCFTISSKTLFSSGNWSVFHHDFQAQYKKIVEMIENSRAENVITNLQNVILNGYILNDRAKLHPSVIANLKTIMRL